MPPYLSGFQTYQCDIWQSFCQADSTSVCVKSVRLSQQGPWRRTAQWMTSGILIIIECQLDHH
jgi:hypothetical protein